MNSRPPFVNTMIISNNLNANVIDVSIQIEIAGMIIGIVDLAEYLEKEVVSRFCPLPEALPEP